MFDLFRSRETAVRYLLGGLLLLVAVSMVVTLIPGWNGTSSTSTDNPTLATIGGYKLTTAEVAALFQRAIGAQQVPPELQATYFGQFAGNLINERAASYQAERMGITASDDEVLDMLMAQYPQFFQNGALIPKDQFEGALAQQGLTPQDLVDETRSRIVLGKLESTLTQTVVVTPQEIEKTYKDKNTKVKIQYIAFSPAKFASEIKVTDADMESSYKQTLQLYQDPAVYDYQVLVLDQQKVEAATVVPESQLRLAYNASLDNFRMPERVRARHILIKTEGKSDAEKKTLLAKAQDLLKKAKSGADFGDLAKSNSEDSGSATKGGDLDFFVRGQMVPEFDKVAFTLKVNEISDIVTSQFGYHIIQVTAKEPAKVKPFDEVKSDLAAQVKAQTVAESMQNNAEKMRGAWMKSPDNAAEVAKQFIGTEAISVPKGSASDPIPTLGSSPEIAGALGQLKPGEFSNVLALPSNRLAVVRLKSITPPHQQEFAQVKQKVHDYLVGTKTEPYAKEKAAEAVARLNKGEDINAVAKSYKLDVVTTSEYTMAESVDGIGPAQQLRETFTKPAGSVIGPMAVQGRSIVAKIVSQTPPDMALLVAERGQILNDLRESKIRVRSQLFVDSVAAQLVAEGKLKRDEQAIQRAMNLFARR